jgi:hypothetical protein
MQYGLEDWHNHAQEERNTHLVEFLDKEKYTEYFVDLVVDYPWRKHPKNPHKHMMDNVQ